MIYFNIQTIFNEYLPDKNDFLKYPTTRYHESLIKICRSQSYVNCNHTMLKQLYKIV